MTWCFRFLRALCHANTSKHPIHAATAQPTATTIEPPQTNANCTKPHNPPPALTNHNDSAALRARARPPQRQPQRRERARRGSASTHSRAIATLNTPLTESAATLAPAQPAGAADGARGGPGEPGTDDGGAGGERARAGRLRRRPVYGGRQGAGRGDGARGEGEGVSWAEGDALGRCAAWWAALEG